jgi:hypothetical protein
MLTINKNTVRKALFTLLSICLCFNLITLNQLIRRYKFQPVDQVQISLFIQRLEKISKKLPSMENVGYLNDYLGEKGLAQIDPEADPDTWGRYYLTQYSLAPIIVEYNPYRRYIVGNFRDSTLATQLESRGYKILEDFGGGVFLIERI